MRISGENKEDGLFCSCLFLEQLNGVDGMR
jgi:hypothetical protein